MNGQLKKRLITVLLFLCSLGLLSAQVILEPDKIKIIEAEDGVLNRAIVESDHTGYSGGGYVNYINEAGGYIEWEVNVPSDGPADCVFIYANGGNARPMDIGINGTVVRVNDFAGTGEWTNWTPAKAVINLVSGNNTIRLTATGADGGPNLDRLEITFKGNTLPGIHGDVNGDGKVDIVDALMTAQYYVGLDPKPFNSSVADVNCDNNLNIVDALIIAQYYVGLINTFSACVTPTPEPTQVPTPTTIPTPTPEVVSPGELVGYAAVMGDGLATTTGGGDATPQIVTTLAELETLAGDSVPRVLHISGTIKTGSYAVPIGSNKTLVGVDKNATIYGGIVMKDVSNIIIRNLNIQGTYPNSGPDDTIASHRSHHIWYDHLNVWDATDGILDITNESSYQTVSWCKFWYTSSSHGHRLASLNGSGGGDHPEDWGRLKITYHHNWWAELVDQRMPRVMYGEGHQFNNYFNSKGNGYCIGVGSYGSILVENNYFKDVNNPHQFMYDVYMYAEANGNIYDNTKGAKDTGHGGSRDACPGGDCSIQSKFKPGPIDIPYPYTLDPAESVPEMVMNNAGPQ